MTQDKIYVRLQTRDIDLFGKIIEACSHIGIVSTVNAEAGLAMVHVTPDTHAAVLDVINHLPFPAEIVMDCE